MKFYLARDNIDDAGDALLSFCFVLAAVEHRKPPGLQATARPLTRSRFSRARL
jgi:hypothetical protein